MIQGVLLDLSGVLYVGEDRLPGAQEALQRLSAEGIPFAAVTNTTRTPRAGILKKLQRLGLGFPGTSLFTAPMAARAYLDAHGLSPILLIHPALRGEFADRPKRPADSVLVGDAAQGFTYQRLNNAFRLLMEGAPLLAMGRTRYYRDSGGLSLDAGPFVAALEYAAAVQARVLGKPAAEFFDAAVAHLGGEPGHVVMVGDDADSDVVAAIQAGLQGILVRTGKYQPGDEVRVRAAGGEVAQDILAAVTRVLDRRD